MHTLFLYLKTEKQLGHVQVDCEFEWNAGWWVENITLANAVMETLYLERDQILVYFGHTRFKAIF